MTDEQIISTIRQAVYDHGIDEYNTDIISPLKDEFSIDTFLYENYDENGLELDELDLVSIISKIETKLKIDFVDIDYAIFKSIDDILQTTKRLLSEKENSNRN